MNCASLGGAGFGVERVGARNTAALGVAARGAAAAGLDICILGVFLASTIDSFAGVFGVAMADPDIDILFIGAE